MSALQNWKNSYYPAKEIICTLFVQIMEFVLRVSNVFNICIAGILEQSMRARNRVGIGSYRPARLHRPTESIPGPHYSLIICL